MRRKEGGERRRGEVEEKRKKQKKGDETKGFLSLSRSLALFLSSYCFVTHLAEVVRERVVVVDDDHGPFFTLGIASECAYRN